MITDLKQYLSMRDSGVPWLGRMPKHWKVLQLRQVLRRHAERDRPDLPLLSVVREKGVIPRDTTNAGDNHNFIPDDLSNYKVVRVGQFAMNKMKAWQGSYGVSRHDGIVSPAYFVFRVMDLVPEYFHTAIRSRAYVPFFTQASDGVRIGQWDLSLVRLREIPFAVPPAAEQTAIIRFLDHVDRKIQRYIRAKQKLIALLEEQKQATIHQAVTGQIDVRTSQPYSAYKDSGGEWLEKIPAHWEVTRLGKLITLTTGFPFKSEGFTQNARDVRLLRGVNVAPGRLRWREVVRWPAADVASYGEYLLETGDIALGMDRPVIRAGTRVALVSECDVPSLLLQRVARIRPSRRIRRDFALLLLRGKAFADYLAPIFTGISVPHLSPEQIRGFRLPLPSVGEQDEILEGLSLGIRAVEREKDRAKSQIELLREYCTRLSADVVTGKVDVREAAAQLPDADPLETDDALEDTPSTDQPADLDEPGIQRNELRS